MTRCDAVVTCLYLTSSTSPLLAHQPTSQSETASQSSTTYRALTEGFTEELYRSSTASQSSAASQRSSTTSQSSTTHRALQLHRGALPLHRSLQQSYTASQSYTTPLWQLPRELGLTYFTTGHWRETPSSCCTTAHWSGNWKYILTTTKLLYHKQMPVLSPSEDF